MKNDTTIQQKNVNELLKLIKDNPQLRVLPMVDSEIVADDGFSSWCGSFGESEIDYVWDSGERVYFSDDKECLIEIEIDRIDSEAQVYHESHLLYQSLEDRATERVNNYSWEKVIVVNIDLP